MIALQSFLAHLLTLHIKGFVPLPKSVTPSRIEENAEVYDFELTKDEVKTLDTGDYAPCSWDPTTASLKD